MSSVCVLGPQRLKPTVADAVAGHGALSGHDPHFAVVTAGWEELEKEDEELREHLCAQGGRVTNLELFARTEDVFRRDPEFLEETVAVYQRLRRLQDLYRVRLAHALDAARELLARPAPQDDGDLLEDERAEAIEDVRRIDASQLERLREVRAAFRDQVRPHERDAVVRHRAEIEGLLTDATCVCIAGGHVQVLLNRLRLYDLPELIGGRPIFAWSAGAMALSERVVVFHDSPPWGPGNAEVIDVGLGLFRGLVPLPHAKRRLRLDDPVRVGLFARRFGPALCAVLDEGTRVEWDGERWTAGEGTQRLREDGALEEITG